MELTGEFLEKPPVRARKMPNIFNASHFIDEKDNDVY